MEEFYDRKDKLSEYEALHRKDEAIDELQHLLLSDEFESFLRQNSDLALTVNSITDYKIDRQLLPPLFYKNFRADEDLFLNNLSMGLYQTRVGVQSSLKSDWFFATKFNINATRFHAEADENSLELNELDYNGKRHIYSYPKETALELTTILLSVVSSGEKRHENSNITNDHTPIDIVERLQGLIVMFQSYDNYIEASRICPFVKVDDKLLQIRLSSRGDELSDTNHRLWIARPVESNEDSTRTIIDSYNLHSVSEELDKLDLNIERYPLPLTIDQLTDRNLPLDTDLPKPQTISLVTDSSKWIASVNNLKAAIENASHNII